MVPVTVKVEHALPTLDASNVGAGGPAPVSPPWRLPTRSADLASALPTTALLQMSLPTRLARWDEADRSIIADASFGAAGLKARAP